MMQDRYSSGLFKMNEKALVASPSLSNYDERDSEPYMINHVRSQSVGRCVLLESQK